MLGARVDPAQVTVLGFALRRQPGADGAAQERRPRSQVADRLRQASVWTIAPRTCAERLGLGGAATGDVQICAGTGRDETCVGDSGSPLVAEGPGGVDRVIGLVSFGTGCAEDLPVTVYTRVSAYAGWIAETMRRQ